MKKNLISLPIFLIALIGMAQPRVSFTFDDGITKDRSGYPFEEWNDMILSSLDNAEVTALFFVSGSNKSDEKGRYLLESWDNKGHGIGNHTYSHPNFNSDKNNLVQFKDELIGTDTIISTYANYEKLFRFPYLKEGNSEEEVNGIRSFMAEQGYRNGYVTIDASDWYVDSRLRKRLKEDPKADLSEFKAFYLEHIYERALFYEGLSYKMNNRHISHTLLLHHNLAAALFLKDLIEMFKEKGWTIISAQDAYEDPIFDSIPNYAGESLIWALAKDSGLYEDQLRYPAEDSRYEKDKMDELGL